LAHALTPVLGKRSRQFLGFLRLFVFEIKTRTGQTDRHYLKGRVLQHSEQMFGVLHARTTRPYTGI